MKSNSARRIPEYSQGDSRTVVLVAGADSSYLRILGLVLHQAGFAVTLLIEERSKGGVKPLPFFHRLGESLYQKICYKSWSAKREHYERYWKDRLPPSLPFPVQFTPSLNSREARQRMKSLAPEMMLTFAPRFLKKKTFSLPAKGTFNLHAGKLPEFRGTLTEFWTMYHRRYEDVGISFHQVSSKLDQGDVAFFPPVPARKGDDELDARLRWQRRLLHVLPDWVRQILEGEVSPAPQPPASSPPYRTPRYYHQLRLKFRNLFFRKSRVEDEISFPPGKTAAFCISSDIDCTGLDRFREVHDWFRKHPPLDQFRDSCFFSRVKSEKGIRFQSSRV